MPPRFQARRKLNHLALLTALAQAGNINKDSQNPLTPKARLRSRTRMMQQLVATPPSH